MRVIGLMMVRNEGWILRCSLPAALRWCDQVMVLDHGSEDDTSKIISEIADQHPGRVAWEFAAASSDWQEMDLRQITLDAGREMGGTHFAMIDADEVLTANYIWAIRRWVKELQPGDVLDVPMVPAWRDPYQQRVDDCVWTSAWLSVAFADDDGMAWRAAGDGYQHHHRCPYGVREVVRRGSRGEGGAMHLQFANPRRLLAKHRLYACADWLRWPKRETPVQLKRKYTQALDERALHLEKVPDAWWQGHCPQAIDIDGVPWHEGALETLKARNPGHEWHGLDQLEFIR